MFLADQLLNPISADQPCGTNLAFSSDFDAIEHARHFGDRSLDPGVWVTDIKEADWDFVVSRCATLLEQKSKDLQLAVWLTEAGAKKYHLRGLAEGFRLIAGLLERYWDVGLYPQADSGDQELRNNNLGWILNRAPALLRAIPVTDGNGSAYSTIDFEVARKNPDGPAFKLKDLEAARELTSVQFRTAFAADVRYFTETLQQLERAADQRFGSDGPGFAATRDALQAMTLLVPSLSPAAATPVQTSEPVPQSREISDASAETSIQLTKAIHTRSQAIEQLRAIAKFFRKSEPHSPVSYLADKAADAGEQDLHKWLQCVIRDQGTLAHIEELLGVQHAAPGDGPRSG